MFNIIKPKQMGLALTITMLMAISSSAFPTNEFQTKLLEAANTKKSGEYVREHFLERVKKPFSQKSKKKLLLIGDSHAQDFLNGILENKFLADYQISTRYIPVRCQIFLGEDKNRKIARKDKSFCGKSDSLSKAKDQIAKADVIILAASWKEWAAKLLPQTIKNMKLNDKQKLFVIGRKSFGKISIRNYLRLPKDKLRTLRTTPDKFQSKISTIMNKALNKSVFINTQKLICGTSGTCPVFTKDLSLISFDGGHLTKDGARYVGKILFKDSLLRQL